MGDDKLITYEMTGSPEGAGFKHKKDLIAFLADRGYVKDDLSRLGAGVVPDQECELLLTDSYDSNTSKMRKAKKLGVPIKTYQDLIKELE